MFTMVKVTKKALREKCQEILHKPNRPHLSPLNEEEFEFMMGILQMHPDPSQKIGCGVKKIWVQQNQTSRHRHTKCFHFEREDGSTSKFGFNQCLSPKDPFPEACREAIDPQVLKFRVDNGMDSTRHADHHPESFKSILKRFVADNGKGELRPKEDHISGSYLACEEYSQKWQDFHQAEAVLRNVSAECNLKKPRK